MEYTLKRRIFFNDENNKFVTLSRGAHVRDDNNSFVINDEYVTSHFGMFRNDASTQQIIRSTDLIENYDIEKNDVEIIRALKFTTDGPVTFNISHKSDCNYDLQYSYDNLTWNQLYDDDDVNSDNFIPYNVITLNANETLYLRGNNPQGFENALQFAMQGDGNVSCTGNIMHLLSYEIDMTEIPCNGCFVSLFSNCENLVSAPELPATTLTENCYECMFENCTSLVNAPELPAMTLADSCYNYMFSGCTNLVNAPELPATTLADYCYASMFAYCSNLEVAPELPAENLEESCYSEMFSECTSLKTTPRLPATTLASWCYEFMFNGCSNIETACELPATTLEQNCYANMFVGCSSLKETPVMKATTLANYCCASMFEECTSLIIAHPLLAITAKQACYSDMFYGCTSLVTAPDIRLKNLAKGCCYNMFTNCENLEYGPVLYAESLVDLCYSNMFNGCEKLHELTTYNTMFDYYINSKCTTNWISSDNETFTQNNIKCGNLHAPYAYKWTNYESNTSSTIPYGWILSEAEDAHAVKFDFVDAEDINFRPYFGPGINYTLQVSEDGLDWHNYDGNSYTRCKHAAFVRGVGNTTLTDCMFDINAKFDVSGNIMHLLDYMTPPSTAPDYCFSAMSGIFESSKVVNAKDLKLPATIVGISSYFAMFKYCNYLVTAPTELPATTLSDNCYESMFAGCGSLVKAPDIAATDFKANCCSHMFDMAGISVAPKFTVNTVDEYCCNVMFGGCTNLKSVEGINLAADTLASHCYNQMFGGSGIETAPELPATKLADYCYSNMFWECNSLKHACTKLPATEAKTGCYMYMFMGCDVLETVPTELPATTLHPYCYLSMFEQCTSLKHACTELPATTLPSSCYQSMFEDCNNLEEAPIIKGAWLTPNCCQSMFNGCSKIDKIDVMFNEEPNETSCGYWLYEVSPTGTFIVRDGDAWNIHPNNVQRGKSTIPEGWTIELVA